MKEKDFQDFWKYIILGSLACITVLAIGYIAKGMFESILTILSILLFVWIYLILKLIFTRVKKNQTPFTISPGDYDHLGVLQERALTYCDENINYYQGARYSSRRYYVNFQLATALLTGITPVLILIDKSESLLKNLPDLQNIFPWLIIIVPAIASILATTTTIFNFQEDWVQSKRTAEALEALREEYLIGASDFFRLDLPNRDKNELARRALENFVLKVNEIHLQQIERWASLHSRTKELNKSNQEADDFSVIDDELQPEADDFAVIDDELQPEADDFAVTDDELQPEDENSFVERNQPEAEDFAVIDNEIQPIEGSIFERNQPEAEDSAVIDNEMQPIEGSIFEGNQPEDEIENQPEPPSEPTII